MEFSSALAPAGVDELLMDDAAAVPADVIEVGVRSSIVDRIYLPTVIILFQLRKSSSTKDVRAPRLREVAGPS